jgi:hypothetical protein
VKSSPHRVLLTWCGTALALCGAVAWILLRKRWREIDPGDPGRLLAEEMATSVALTARRFAATGAAARSAVARRFGGKNWPATPEAAEGERDVTPGITQTSP